VGSLPIRKGKERNTPPLIEQPRSAKLTWAAVFFMQITQSRENLLMKTTFRLIEENSLHARKNGWEFQIRLNWYRSLPFSCIETVHVKLNGVPVAPEKIGFRIQNQVYSISELADLVEEFWFVQDPATIVIDQSANLSAGEETRLEVDIAVRAPYIPTGPGQYLTITTADSISMVAQ
jgi:hypothetical protein